MRKYKRVFIIILDSFGIGYQPDAERFGDAGANTLFRIFRSESFNIPTLLSLGFGNIDGCEFLGGTDTPLATVARLREVSAGKDTTVGHFELMGAVSEKPFPTYPAGFPDEIIAEFSKRCGRRVLCNRPYSGTEVIRDYGDMHRESGDFIVYTSQDSVFQIAAHEEVVSLEELYSACKTAREILVGENGVARVIARPFIGESGKYVRTANRRDFSIKPPHGTALDAIKESGREVIAVGKINDIFAGEGITESIISHSNREGMEITESLLDRDFSGLCFTNLVEFDSHYGHRQDVDGYAEAISEFDAWLQRFIEKLAEDDLLMITADHGCDPGDDSTDHTREYVPLFILGSGIIPENLGTLIGFYSVGKTAAQALGAEYKGPGEVLV